MASTRSNAITAETAFVTLVRRSVRIHIAACATTAKTLIAWAESADRLAQAVGDELLLRIDGETDSAELAARVTAASDTHLQELSALPRVAADHFDARLVRASIDN